METDQARKAELERRLDEISDNLSTAEIQKREILDELEKFKVTTPSDLAQKYGDRLSDLAIGYLYRGTMRDFGGMVDEGPVWSMPGDLLSELYAKTLHDAMQQPLAHKRIEWLTEFLTDLDRVRETVD